MKISKVAKYWNKRGGTYDRSWQSIAKKRLSQLETDLIDKAITDSKNKSGNKNIKVLDIGVAIGRICDTILKHNVELYGTDVSQTMVDYCKDKYRKIKKAKGFILHDVHDPLPKKWGKFDVVSAYRVLAYTPHLQKELTTIYNAMNNDGILVFTYPNKYSSALLPKLIYSKNRMGNEKSASEIRKIIKKVGFREYRIGGYSRLIDTLYDMCDSRTSANIIFGIENLLSKLLGKTLFMKLFYVTCVK